MTDEQILQAVAEKAIKNGWKSFGLLKGVLDGEICVGMNPNVYHALLMWDDYYRYIFNHDFARALWGTDEYCKKEHPQSEFKESCNWSDWQYHLREMVLAKNPLEYLRQFV